MKMFFGEFLYFHEFSMTNLEVFYGSMFQVFQKDPKPFIEGSTTLQLCSTSERGF